MDEGARRVADEVERLLVTRYAEAGRVTVREMISEPDGRHLVLRCALEMAGDNSSLPDSIIVKRLREPAQSSLEERRGFVRECAGAEFVGSLAAVPAPRIVLADAATGLLVAEDLGTGRGNLADALLGDDPERAEAALTAYATSLALLHTAARPRVDRYEQWLARHTELGHLPATIETEALQHTAEFCAWLRTFFELPSGFESTLTEMVVRVHRPGPFYTFVHGDACPDNTVLRGEKLFWIDFELGHLGSALIDAVYLRAPFPSCWCCGRLPEATLTRLERCYREELSRRCSAGRDAALFEAGMVEASAHWLVRRFAWFLPGALDDDKPLGLCGRRSRLLGAVGELAARARDFVAYRSLLTPLDRLAELLGQRWPEAAEIPLFPAFRGRSGPS